MPSATVIPVLVYDNVNEAVEWLCHVFQLTLRLRIANHRAQLLMGQGAIMIGERPADLPDGDEFRSHSLLIRVENVNTHYDHAREHGARILQPPTDYPYGERQYTALDIGGHSWTFSESVFNAVPEDWGGVLIKSEES